MCGLSTRKTRTPCADPVEDDVAERRPQPLPVLAVEVDVVDVLVALGRVLRVLQRPVRAAVEPLGVLLQPRVVGRALDREVEGDLDPGSFAAATIRSNSWIVPSSGSTAVWPPSSLPIAQGCRDPRRRPSARCSAPCGSCGRSGGSAAGRQRRSRALQLGQHLLDAGEAAPGAREELVPGAEASDLTVAVDPERAHELRQPRGGRPPSRRARSRRRAGAPSRAAAPSCELARRGRPARPRPCDAARRGTTRAVDPRLDGELPAAEPVTWNRPTKRSFPCASIGASCQSAEPGARYRTRAEHVVAVAEDRRPDLDLVADRPLDRVAAAVDLGPDVLDLDPWWPVLGKGHDVA